MNTRAFVSIGRCALVVASLAAPTLAQNAAPTGTPNEPRQVQVSVDYVHATGAQFDSASRKARGGPSHDARLLAALVRAGAQDTKGPQITTTDGVSGVVGFKTQIGPSPQGLTLNSSTEVTPRINKDGSITAELKLQRDALVPDVTPPAKTTQSLTAVRTFRVGQTLLLSGTLQFDTKTKATSRDLVFAQVALVAAPPNQVGPVPAVQH